MSKLAGPLMKVAIPLAKSVLAPLRITAAASAIDAGIQKKTKKHGSGNKTLIISNEEMNIIKIIQALENSNILIKGITKTKNENKRTKRRISKYVNRYFRS